MVPQHCPFSLHTMLEGPWLPKTTLPTPMVWPLDESRGSSTLQGHGSWLVCELALSMMWWRRSFFLQKKELVCCCILIIIPLHGPKYVVYLFRSLRVWKIWTRGSWFRWACNNIYYQWLPTYVLGELYIPHNPKVRRMWHNWIDTGLKWFEHQGSFHSQLEHHVQDKFATPILYGIDNFKFYDIFSTYT